MNVGSLLKEDMYVVKVNDSIEKALEMMNTFKINGMPVLDDEDKVLGMVVKADIYRFMINPGHYESCPVEWVMSKSIILADSNEDVITVAKRLRKNNIVSIPVVNNEKFVGIINIEDLLDYLLIGY